MKDNYGCGLRPASRWARRSRIAAAFTVVACAAMLAGCGGGSSPGTSGESSAYAKAEAYARCMRSHGVPGFPDPDAQGRFPPVQGNGVRQAVQSAENACQGVRPGGAQGGKQQQQGRQTQALNFSKCMRAHGIPNFPDPSASNGGMGYNMAGVDTHSPQYQSAQQACRSQQSAGGAS